MVLLILAILFAIASAIGYIRDLYPTLTSAK